MWRGRLPGVLPMLRRLRGVGGDGGDECCESDGGSGSEGARGAHESESVHCVCGQHSSHNDRLIMNHYWTATEQAQFMYSRNNEIDRHEKPCNKRMVGIHIADCQKIKSLSFL